MNNQRQLRTLLSQVWKEGCEIQVQQQKLKLNGSVKNLSADLLEVIKKKKFDIIDYLSSTSEFIVPHPEEAIRAPVSAFQSSIWFAHQIMELGNAYSMPVIFSFEGKLNVKKLKKAFELIIARHDILRVHLRKNNDSVEQYAINDLSLPFYEEIISGDVQSRIQELIREPFDLEAGPLIRLHCLVGENQTKLMLNMHHIIGDGVSINILLQELALLYESKNLEPLIYQYSDYARAQKRWLKHPKHQIAFDFWRESLKDIPECISLPIKQNRSTSRNAQGRAKRFELGASVTRNLNVIAKELNVTPFVASLAAFFLVLHKVSGQNDVCVGTPFANRGTEGSENLVGLFVNTLPISSKFHDRKLFGDFVRDIQEQVLQVYEWQNIPLEHILSELKLKRNPAYSPLFQVMFAYQNHGQGHLCFDGLKGTPQYFAIEQVKYDLKLTLIEAKDGLNAVFEYSTALFDEQTINRFASYYNQVFAGLNVNTSLGELSILTQQEHEYLTTELNQNTLLPPPPDVSLTHLIEKQANLSPEKIVLVHEDECLDYETLNKRANQLAHSLVEHHHVQQGELVGICTQRGLDMVTAMLAILKAGAAYVPLDPDYPAERLSYIVEDARLKVVLTQQKSQNHIACTQSELVVIDAANAAWRSCSDVDFASDRAVSSDLAYVIYTSGSTGRPKGVMIEHGNVLAMLEWAYSAYNPEELRSILASTSICFDLSVYEIFLPLCYGFQCVIVENLLDLLESQPDVSLINSVPTALQLMVEQDVVPKSVKVVNSAGESLPSQLVNDLLKKGVSRVCNLYGPSEDTTYSTFASYHSTLKYAPNIGKVIDFSQGYILSEEAKLLPLGAVGELYLAGRGLARGYLYNESLTQEKFVSNPFYNASNPDSSSRLYKTGDLVRYLPSGNLEYLGRIDEQVKVRGFRIELKEIENVITQLSWIDSALVIMRETKKKKHLVAYFKVSSDYTSKDPVSAVRTTLRETLPNFMMPDAYLLMTNWPLLPNGKIARKQLPEPEETSFTGEYLAPQTAIEHELTAIWSNILGIEKGTISIEANFFELGGDSILVAKVLSSISQSYKVKVSFSDMFKNASVAQLAAYIENAAENAAPLLDRMPAKTTLPASPQQTRYFDTYNIECTTSKRMTNIFGFWKSAELLEKSVQSMVDCHELFRTGFFESDSGELWISIFDTASLKAVQMHCVSEDVDTIRLQMYERIQQEHFDMQAPPLLKLVVNRLDDGSCYAVIGIFNGILDAYSGGLIKGEIDRIYAQLLNGKRVTEPELQYQDFIQWQHLLAKHKKYEQARSFWQKTFPKDYQHFYLPKRYPACSGGSMLTFLLGEELTNLVHQKAKHTGSGLFTFLLSNFFELASNWYQRKDVSIGLLYHGRDQTMLEDKIGYFVDMLCVKANVEKNHPIESLVHQVNEAFYQSIDHRTYQYQDLAARHECKLTESRFPITALHVNNVIVPGEEKQIPVDFKEQTFNLPYEPKFDLNIYLHESNRGIFIRMAYANSVLSLEDANKFAQQLKDTVEKNCK